MKTILTISIFFLSYLTFSQSVAYTKITIIEVDDETGDIVKQYNTGYYMEFIVSDTSVNYLQKDHIGGTLEEIHYEIIKKETTDEMYIINMKADDVLYELHIPTKKRNKIALKSNGLTKIIAGKIEEL